MTVQQYNLGQVVYVALKKENVVMPALIAKRTKEETLDGDIMSYTVLMGKEKKPILLDSVAGEVFENAQAAKDVLTSRATRAINALVENAVIKAKEWYAVVEPKPKRQKKQQVVERVNHVDDNVQRLKQEFMQESFSDEVKTISLVEEEYDFVDIGNGQLAKVKRQ